MVGIPVSVPPQCDAGRHAKGRRMGVSLVLVKSDGKQQEIPLRKAVHVIGRHTDCQIRIPSSGISRHHCELVVSDSKVVLRDLGSSNGTFVNRKKITQSDLAAGDLVALGEVVFVLRVDGKPETIDAEEAYDEGLVRSTPVPAAAASIRPDAPTRRMEVEKDASSDSSMADFDFLDEDDEIKRQPKL